MPNISEIFELMCEPTQEDKKLIERTYHFAAKAHEGQKRASGEPYFNHVFATGKNLAQFGMDATTIAAGFLHDTLEDTKVTEEEMEKEFGTEICFLVKGVTKLGKVKYNGVERHVESMRKFFVAAAEDIRVLIIKFADRLHNVQTLEYVREDKRKRIALETIEIHAPLANRLGMGKLKGELEDYAFPYAFPKEYEKVETILKERTNINQKNLDEVHSELLHELEKNNIKLSQTDYRIKHKYSLYKKLLKHDMDIEKIYDIIALRIIVNSIEDCYRVLGMVHGTWTPLPGRVKDYIALPKTNGYQSIHTTVFTGSGGIAEIQIRTEEMHKAAEYGIAAHFIYKEGENNTRKKFAWLHELESLDPLDENSKKEFEHIKKDLFTDRIFVFTPDGDVIDLPEDSSPIDFAYAIHTDVGNHASGAKINGKYSALKTKLKTNDIVFIETKETAKPTSGWLEYAKSNFARKQIRTYIQNEGSFIDKYLSRRYN